MRILLGQFAEAVEESLGRWASLFYLGGTDTSKQLERNLAFCVPSLASCGGSVKRSQDIVLLLAL